MGKIATLRLFLNEMFRGIEELRDDGKEKYNSGVRILQLLWRRTRTGMTVPMMLPCHLVCMEDR